MARSSYNAKHPSIVVSDKTWAALKSHADKTGKPMAQLIAEMVEREFKEKT